MSNHAASATSSPPAIPKNFVGYVRSMGPGIIVVLTWLGAGDIVDSAVAGSNYGYALMWAMMLALLMRYLFVTMIAKYQLCNERGENVFDGLARLHAWFPPFIAVTAFFLVHILGSYMLLGLGEACVQLTGREDPSGWEVFGWAVFWSAAAVVLVVRPAYRPIEIAFKIMLGILTVSFVGLAIWSGPDPMGILRGTLEFALPPTQGPFDSLLVAVSLVGAVGGSLMNLLYPVLMEQKGWRGPEYRRLQRYDLLFGVVMMILLVLSVWTLGAELMHAQGKTVKGIDDLANLLGSHFHQSGRAIFYLGILAALFTSLVGQSMGLASMASIGFLHWRTGRSGGPDVYTKHPVYWLVAIWGITTPLVWALPIPSLPNFVTLTILGNSIQVVLIPPLAVGIWCLTANSAYIGSRFRNRWWENVFMLLMVSIAVWSAYGTLKQTLKQVSEYRATEQSNVGSTADRCVGPPRPVRNRNNGSGGFHRPSRGTALTPSAQTQSPRPSPA